MATATRGPRLKNISEIASQISATIGAEFFESLAKTVGESLSADCLYIGEFVGGQVERVRTVIADMNDHAASSPYYSLPGTVAAQVVTGSALNLISALPGDW